MRKGFGWRWAEGGGFGLGGEFGGVVADGSWSEKGARGRGSGGDADDHGILIETLAMGNVWAGRSESRLAPG